MILNLLASEILRFPIWEIIESVIPRIRVRTIEFNSQQISKEVFDANLWIIEAFRSARRPSGFHTAYHLGGNPRCLLLFTWIPAGFPSKGPCWNHILDEGLVARLEHPETIEPARPEILDKMKEMWPLLAYRPTDEHGNR